MHSTHWGLPVGKVARPVPPQNSSGRETALPALLSPERGHQVSKHGQSQVCVEDLGDTCTMEHQVPVRLLRGLSRCQLSQEAQRRAESISGGEEGRVSECTERSGAPAEVFLAMRSTGKGQSKARRQVQVRAGTAGQRGVDTRASETEGRGSWGSQSW